MINYPLILIRDILVHYIHITTCKLIFYKKKSINSVFINYLG